jgi:pilus assembly protein Flp/PilA
MTPEVLMKQLMARAQATWATRDQGATAVEYGLMVALVAVAIIVAVTLLGSKLTGLFNKIAGSLG